MRSNIFAHFLTTANALSHATKKISVSAKSKCYPLKTSSPIYTLTSKFHRIKNHPPAITDNYYFQNPISYSTVQSFHIPRISSEKRFRPEIQTAETLRISKEKRTFALSLSMRRLPCIQHLRPHRRDKYGTGNGEAWPEGFNYYHLIQFMTNFSRRKLLSVFIKGFLSFFSIEQNPIKAYEKEFKRRNDKENMAQDWENVGNDIKHAYEKFNSTRFTSC